MTDIERLIQVLDKGQIPLNVALWSSEDIANYLRVSKKTVMENIVCQPSFPKRIQIKMEGRTMHPRWKAKDVISWVESN